MSSTEPATQMALLFDVTHCIGCGACYEACKERNQLPETSDDFLNDRLSANTFTILETKGEEKYSRRLCMHCQVPTCVSVCPVAALEKTAQGPVVYHGDRCIGCRYCMQACPFNIPTYEWDALWPLIRKCDMCASRVAEGQVTACTEACPADATVFGTREEMIAEARRRIAENPGGYINHIYGLEEIGGTSVLFISDIPFESLGLPMNLGTEPLPELTWAVLSKIPRFSVLAAVVMGGIWWITKRREEVARVEGKGHH